MARTIPDLRKAAILVASVDRDTARTLLAKLLPEQIEQLEFAISRLGPIDDEEREAVLSEFAQTAPAASRPASIQRDRGGPEVELELSTTARASHHDADSSDPAPSARGNADTSASSAARAASTSDSPSDATVPHATPPARRATGAHRQPDRADASNDSVPPRSLSSQPPSISPGRSAHQPAQPSAPSSAVEAAASQRPEPGGADRPDLRIVGDHPGDDAPRASTPPDPDARAAFAFLQHADEAELVALLANEHPQTTTVVLSHMPPERAARVLAELPDSQQADIVRRLMHLEETHPDVLRELEAGLARHLRCGAGGRQVGGARGTRAVIQMLRAGGRRIERRILDNVRRHDAELAQRIASPKPQLQFGDLLRFEPADRAAWARQADAELLALALLGCSAAEAESVLSVLPAETAHSVRQKIAHPGPVRLEDIDLAQQTLAQRVERAIDEGRFEPNIGEHHLNMAG